MPEWCARRRSIAKCVFPVLVGPRTAKMRESVVRIELMTEKIPFPAADCKRWLLPLLHPALTCARGGDTAMATEHRVHHRFAGPRAKVWEALADTARFNEALGLPAHPIVAATTPEGERQFRGRARL